MYSTFLKVFNLFRKNGLIFLHAFGVRPVSGFATKKRGHKWRLSRFWPLLSACPQETSFEIWLLRSNWIYPQSVDKFLKNA